MFFLVSDDTSIILQEGFLGWLGGPRFFAGNVGFGEVGDR